ncbi:hypothetical protein [Vibrio hippocampi]|uniref:50S ribosomal protein L20 n=1 Tax=Vibrio hippocampi TaxID=654686 RepID=A0ABN8DGR9_9VIBR|nr:hypothetical protein [Vibrio hippocampi]CAH0524930.1 hypothetical protein VHP8226_00606 [Vibrio hippocampi]
MQSRKRLRANKLNKTVSANRRKRYLANNKKRVIWRNRAFMMQILDART